MLLMILWTCAIVHTWRGAVGNTAQQQQLVEQARAVPVMPVAAQQVPAFVATTGGFAAALPADPQQYYQAAAGGKLFCDASLETYGYPSFLAMAAPLMVLGSPCADNFTCAALPNSFCGANRTCQCMANFIEDPVFTGTCKLGKLCTYVRFLMPK